MTELLAPGGSFQSAMAALDHGADALYCGLSRFSARKSAKNLTIPQLSRLREAIEQRDKKLYIALNTLILDSQWQDMHRLLSELQTLEPHGLILQDLGLLRFIKREFPHYEVHASTQMTIHNAQGARQAWEMGLTRAVLARECTLENIRTIRQEVPELELESFIHGAHCISVSGLCLASGKLLGRSANRGECGQICRTWFQHEDRQGYYFSARDLQLGPEIKMLVDAGVHSLKIEGRMKSPEYAAWTTAWYRALLDGAPEKEQAVLMEKSRIAFSRESTTGWLNNPKGDSMIQNSYPGHKGVPAGVIMSDGQVHLSIPLSERDGLLYIPQTREGELPRGESFSARFAAKPGKKPQYFARAGEMVRLTRNLKPGGELYCISRHDGTLPLVKEEACPLFRPPGLLSISWQGDELHFTCSLSWRSVSCSVKEPFTEARQPGGLKSQISRLFEGKGGPVDIRTITWGEGNWERGFIPSSRLKAIRREVREYLEEALHPSEIEGHFSQEAFPSEQRDLPDKDLLRHRELFNPGGGKIPFVASVNDFKLENLRKEEGRFYLPLNPFLRKEKDYFHALKAFLQEHEGLSFVLGLNNSGHLRLCKDFENQSDISFWVDYGLYCANREAFAYYLEKIPRLRTVLYWIEGPEEEAPEGSTIAADFSPPLFTSASCFHHHSLGNPCPGNCPKSYEYTLRQKDRDYLVLVKDCISYLFLK